MSLIKRFAAVVVLIMGTVAVNGQDIHFSQFYMSPLNLNPALTGVMNCNQRLVSNYRNQWSAVMGADAFNTYSVSYDQKFSVGRYDYFGIGATFWGDVAGQLNFGTVTGKLSASYSKKMAGYRSESHFLVFGFEGGLSQRRIDFLEAVFPEQISRGLDAGSENFGDFINGETNLDVNNFLFANLAAGVMWFSNFDENTNLYIGGSYNNLNRPNQAWGKDVVQLNSRISIHAGGQFLINKKIALLPGIVFFNQGPSMQINGGTNLRFLLGNSKRYYQAFQIGTWVRYTNKLESAKHIDALILSTRFEYESFGIGFSYDINVSDLKAASNYNGGFEFSMHYKICGPEKRNVYCPRF